jgi:hypothetical protein
MHGVSFTARQHGSPLELFLVVVNHEDLVSGRRTSAD